MVSQTRAVTRSRTRSGRYVGRFAGLEVEGQSSSEDNDQRPQTPSTPLPTTPSTRETQTESTSKTKSPKKRKAEGPTDVTSDETSPTPGVKRGRPSAEQPATSKKQKLEPNDDMAKSEQVEEAPHTWPLCIMRARNFRNTYRRGQIILLPIPQPNLDPTLTTENQNLYRTRVGGVYSKLRMAVVLYRFTTRMMVLPMYSWGGRGITSQRKASHGDYVEICNESDRRRYIKQGVNDVLGAVMNKDPGLTKLGCLSLAGAFSVDYREDVEIIGVMTTNSHSSLQAMMEKLLNTVARDEN